MRLSLFAAIVAGATLAQVGASPLRVVVISNNLQDLPSTQNLRFGHTLANSHVAKISAHNHPSLINLQQPGRLCGKRIKDKAIQISNVFRHALGLPLIETAQARPGDNVHGGMVRILPFIGTPPTFIEAERNTDSPYFVKSFHHKVIGAQPDTEPHRHHRHHHHFQHWDGNTFTTRIHNALMSLGPWEGRAVAFVLGCGIGVLLRMLWVLTVVTFRTIRGERDDEYTQVAVIEEYVDAEDIVVPPPTYTVSDEKEQIKAKDANEN